MEQINILKININSFSFKKGLPKDKTIHGGGFIFDCRWIENPGRFEQYKKLTGKDIEVQQFLEQNTQMPLFLNQIKDIVNQVILKYQERNFDYLAINFGCTGGQHRSVFAALKINDYIINNYKNIETILNHREIKL